jgi:hypothetical protein
VRSGEKVKIYFLRSLHVQQLDVEQQRSVGRSTAAGLALRPFLRGMIIVRWPPTFIPLRSSQPLMTRQPPRGSRMAFRGPGACSCRGCRLEPIVLPSRVWTKTVCRSPPRRPFPVLSIILISVVGTELLLVVDDGGEGDCPKPP